MGRKPQSKSVKQRESSSSPYSPPSETTKTETLSQVAAQTQAVTVASGQRAEPLDQKALQYKMNVLTNHGGMINVGMLMAMKAQEAGKGPQTQSTAIPKRLAPEQQKPFKSLRSVIFSGLNPSAKSEGFQEFLQKVFVRAGGAVERAGNPLVGIDESFAKGEASVEFRSLEEASAALALSGLNYVFFPQ